MKFLLWFGVLSPLAFCAGLDASSANKAEVNWTAIVMFVVFVIATLSITYFSNRISRSTSGFYTGGGNISGLKNGTAIAGDFMSAASFLGIVGLVFSNGFDGLIYAIGFLVGWPIIMFLIAEKSLIPHCGSEILAHLDKSHVTVHTYPEYHPDRSLATFRVDIDVATCGEITPLSTLDYLIGSFDSDIITMDYRVRGFTRDVKGKKIFLDHKIHSIQDYINKNTLLRYNAIDVNVFEANIFHTKMLIKDIDLKNYLFATDARKLTKDERNRITQSLKREMTEIYSGRNIY